MLLKNCKFIVTQNNERKVLENQDILIKGNVIEKIGINLDSDITIDCSNKIVIPGLINLHTHAAMTLFRGYADDFEVLEWLEKKIWPAEAKLTENHVYHGTSLACLEMLRSGTTCFLDMYLHMNGALKAVHKIGNRAFLGEVMFDFNNSENTGSEIKKTKSFFKKVSELNNSKIKAVVMPHAIYSCSSNLLKESSELAKKNNSLLHIHVSENKKEVEDSRKNNSKTPISYLDSLGVLDKNVIIAHCVWPTKEEINLLFEKDVKVAHCPVSNLKLASGIAPISNMEGIVGVGTDGSSSNNSLNMFEEMKLTALLQKNKNKNSASFTAQRALDMATVNGAKALGLNVGSIEEGKIADLALLDTDAYNLSPLRVDNLISSLVYSSNPDNVTDVIVDGKLILKNKKLQTMNETSIIKNTQRASSELITQ